MARSVVISPHLDDGIFSNYKVLTESKNERLLITVFSGVPKKNKITVWDLLCAKTTSEKTMKLRHKENLSVCRLLKLDHLELNFLDHQYKKNINLSRIYEQIKKVVKSDDILYFPIAFGSIYSHPDHEILRNIGIKFLNNNYNVRFYADLPYVNTLDYNFNTLLNKIHKLTSFTFETKHIGLNKKDVTNKISIMKLYKSQFTMTNLVSFGRLGSEQYLSKEILLIKK